MQDYHPDDLKGKGEPAYSIERSLKEHNRNGDHDPVPTDATYIELLDRPRRRQSEGITKSAPGVSESETHGANGNGESSAIASSSFNAAKPLRHTGTGESYAEWEQGRRGSHGLLSEGIKRRIGSIRKGKDREKERERETS